MLIFVLIIAYLTIPVSAFYFDFQYFETDKFVYEVGETINMVAKLVADFSDEGWCYVSFAVVTDLGPFFADEYFIPPSPTVRYLNSSYTILPAHTNPTETGVQAFALFTVEIFDTVYQSAGDNIEITINRGHLAAVPLTTLSIQYGLNASLPIMIASVHNENVVFSGESVRLHVEDMSSQNVLDLNTTTSSEGMIYLNWTKLLGPPGFYNLTISSDGNEDFLPFTDSFEVTVLPAASNLTIVSSPEAVFCQSPDGTHINQAELVIEHSDLESCPIEDSMVLWTTGFGSGILSSLGNGKYSTMIPFNTSPGLYHINITATNPQYQTAQTAADVNVLANSLLFSIDHYYWNVTRGETATIEFFIESTPDWNQSIQLQLTDEHMQFSIIADVLPNQSCLVNIPIWHNLSVGQHSVNVYPISGYYQFITPPQFNLIIFGIIEINVSAGITYYGEFLEFNLNVLDDNNQPVHLVNVSIFCDNALSPLAITGFVNSSISHIVSLPMWIVPGMHNITFVVRSHYFHLSNNSLPLRVWMRTNITIVITASDTVSNNHLQDLSITRIISCGSIMTPPPILFTGITSADPFTARLTSLES